MRKEINCFAGYKVHNVLRDETKIFCVFLPVEEGRVLAWGWGLREGALHCRSAVAKGWGDSSPSVCTPPAPQVSEVSWVLQGTGLCLGGIRRPVEMGDKGNERNKKWGNT